RSWGSVLIASAVVLYFLRQNLLGIHESSDKALKIMIATTVMAVIMLLWCGVTAALPPGNPAPPPPNPSPEGGDQAEKKPDPEFPKQERETWKKDENGKLVPKKDESGQPVAKKSEALGKVGFDVQEDPLGLLGRILPASIVESLRHPRGWLNLFALIGL